MVDTWGPLEEFYEDPDDDGEFWCNCQEQPSFDELFTGHCDTCGKPLVSI